MEITDRVYVICSTTAVPTIILLLTVLLWRAVEFLLLRPRKMERLLREQGLKGNPYKPILGDAKDLIVPAKDVLSAADISVGPLPGITQFCHNTVQKHGKNCFAWICSTPCLIITVPELFKEILNKYEDFQKPNHPFNKLLMVGLIGLEGQDWAKHRKIIRPAFQMEKLKNMVDAMYLCCCEMTSAWNEVVSQEGSTELDVWPFMERLSADAISRSAFGSSYEQGRKIFNLLNEHVNLMMQYPMLNYIPFWSFFPTKTNRRVKQLCKEVEALLTRMVEARKTELEDGGTSKGDLLDLLLESNMREIEQHGNEKGKGLTTKDVVEECKLFYLGGQETTSSLLVWTVILLSKHQIWQDRARKEILEIFENNTKPDFEGLSRLKVVSMILYEALRLYSPAYAVMRKVYKDTKLKEWLIPKGTEILVPLPLLHQDSDIWGKDAKTFNPERFSEGISKAAGVQGAFLPFSTGPRVCIGQNFSLLEARLALAVMLRLFSFDISPIYVHSPDAGTGISLKPKYGAKLILRKL